MWPVECTRFEVALSDLIFSRPDYLVGSLRKAASRIKKPIKNAKEAFIGLL